MVPGSLPNPISFDQYYYCCFLRDGDRKSSIDDETNDTAPTEVHSDTGVTQYDLEAIPAFETFPPRGWKVIGYEILSLIFHFIGGLIQRPANLLQRLGSGMKS